MLWNPGELAAGWTMAKLRGKHSSQPFNPDVANAFFRAGMIEAWGRGIERIMDACRAAGTARPKLRHEPSGLWVEFSFPDAFAQSAGIAPAKTPMEMTMEAPMETRQKIIALITRHPQMTLAEIAAAIGKSKSTVARASARLIQQGRIRHAGPAKAGRWEILASGHARAAPMQTPLQTPIEMTTETPLETWQKVIVLITQHPQMTLTDIAAATGKSLNAVARASGKLVREGRIKHAGSKKAGQWVVLK